MNKRVIALRASIAVALNGGLWWFDRFVEFVMYPVFIGTWGMVDGLAWMMLFSFVICLVLLGVYDFVCTRDPSKVRSPWIRALIEACNDVLGYESVKEAAASAWQGILLPGHPRPPSDYERTAAQNPFLRRMANALRHGLAFVEYFRAFLWEPIRRFAAAPVVRFLMRHRLETTARYLVISFFTDGMTTTIAMRPAHSHRVGLREWALFVPSVILSCLGWGVVVGAGMSGLKFLVHAVAR